MTTRILIVAAMVAGFALAATESEARRVGGGRTTGATKPASSDDDMARCRAVRGG